MMSALRSFGFSSADIATLFGGGASSTGSSAKAGATASATDKTDANAITGLSLIGSGSGAAKAIQTIVTQIQVEKMQANVQGKISTLDSASVSMTVRTTVASPFDQHPIAMTMTAINRTATATAGDSASAINELLTEVKSREEAIKDQQDGVLTTMNEWKLGRGAFSTLVTWTPTSASLATKGFSNEGVLATMEQEVLQNAPQNVSSEAQQFQAASTPSSDNTGATSSTNSTSAGALYLTLGAGIDGPGNGDYSVLGMEEKKLVSAFQNGTILGQNGKAPQDGMGFSWYSEQGGHIYSISGTWISNYDASAAAAKNATATNALSSLSHLYNEPSRYSDIAQSVANGGTVVGVNVSWTQWTLDSIQVIIPLKLSPSLAA